MLNKQDKQYLAQILIVAKKYWLVFIIGVVCMFLSGLVYAWPGLAIKILADAVNTGQAFSGVPVSINLIPEQLLRYGLPEYHLKLDIQKLIHWVPVLFLVIYFLEGVLRFSYLFCTHYFGLLIGNDFRLQLYNKLIHLNFNNTRDRSSGDLASCVTNDTATVQSGISNVLIIIIKDTIYSTIFISGMLLINWRLTLICGIIIPVFFLLVSKLLSKLKKIAHKGQEMAGELVSLVNETAQGMDIIHLMNAYETFNSRFHKVCERFIKLSVKSSMLDSATSPIIGILAAILIGTIAIYIGFNEVLQGYMSIGDFLAYLTATLLLYQPVRRLLRISGPLYSLLGGMQRVFALLSLPSPVSGTYYDDHISTIKFDNVSFGYDPNKPVLKNINFTIEPNELIALVGYSGAGKSTIIKLIPHLYQPDSGQILVNDTNIGDWDINKLRNLISFVPQDPFLFSGTVRENLLLAKPNATDSEIFAALESANVDFIDSLDAPLSERAGNLSGGQKQRLGIARAFLRNTPLIIFDEPSSALDSHSEKLIQTSIIKLMENKTVILITHKLQLVQNFQKIICFKDGEIAEIGNHQELMTHKSYYYSLVNSTEIKDSSF